MDLQRAAFSPQVGNQVSIECPLDTNLPPAHPVSKHPCFEVLLVVVLSADHPSGLGIHVRGILTFILILPQCTVREF
jgi:hypothetical protein